MLRLTLDAQHPLPDAQTLAALTEDRGVRGLWITIVSLHTGWATLTAWRECLGRARAAGAFVVVELENPGNAEIYLASVADRVYLRPASSLALIGVGATLRFFGDALARLGVEFDFEAAGAYKSFGESFTRAFASAANREATASIVASLQEELVHRIAEGRKLEISAVQAALEEAPLSADRAVGLGLADAALYPDAVKAALEQELGEDFAQLPFVRWARARRRLQRLSAWMEGRKRVVVVHLDGAILDDASVAPTDLITPAPTIEALDALREDDNIAGVVLAIRSPGGSAVASDLIWQAATRLAARHPTVAALGDVAASGGYYIAVAATEILALPTTLTGSIGVFGGKPVLSGAGARLGIHSELVVGAPHAGLYSPDRPFSPTERRSFRQSLERTYATFLDRVSRGRKRTVEAIEPHAQGRVWTGRQALELGLVDRLGTIDDAVARVAALASVPVRRVDLVLTPKQGRLLKLVRALGAYTPAGALLEPLAQLSQRGLVLLEVPAGTPLALWPFELELR